MTIQSQSGRYGRFGGRYVAEAIWTPLREIGAAFESAVSDEAFLEEFEHYLNHRLGRPTPLSELQRVTDERGGGRLWAKREDLCQGGSFAGNLAVAYGLLARRLGKESLLSETASGDFGVALGAVANALDLDAHVFMGREDYDSEPLRVRQMEQLGVSLETVDSDSRGRKRAGAEALRFWATHSDSHLYSSSSLAAPDPFPRVISYFLSVIGAETRVQLDRKECRADYVVAPVGSGGFAAGLFSEFIDDENVTLIGVQSAGEGLDRPHSASLVDGRPGVFNGTFSYLLQDEHGQVSRAGSAAGGLSMPVVGPQHARWLEDGRVEYRAVENSDAIAAVRRLAAGAGLQVSLEAGHAVAYALELLGQTEADENVIVGLSGSGMRDLERLAREAAEEDET